MPNRRELGYVSAGSTSTIVATTGYGVATGGTSSSPNISGQDYTVLTFSSDDNLVVSSAGLFDVAATNHSDMIGASNGGATDGNSAKAKTIAAAQGNLGGNGPATTSGGGGGGFGSAGGNASGTTGGAGGNGSEINGFTGGSSSVVSAGGGGGGTVTGGAAGTGGVAGKTTGTGNAGVNPGAGGGGTAQASTGGAGAAGVVVVRFKV
jgi:hypothetical protein